MTGLISRGLALSSPLTRASYGGYLAKLEAFAGNHGLSRELIAEWLAHMHAAGASRASITQATKAVRFLARHAFDVGELARDQLDAILSIKSPKQLGLRSGNWLQMNDVIALLELAEQVPRDAVMLGMMLGCGLRRSEVANMRWEHYQVRDGRFCFVDFTGKGGRIRTVPVPAFLERSIARLTPKGHEIIGGSPANVWHVLKRYADKLSWREGHKHIAGIAPHDLRRTFARLMRDANVPLDQISMSLGHSQLQTTALYLGQAQELRPGLAGIDKVFTTQEKTDGSSSDAVSIQDPRKQFVLIRGGAKRAG